MKPPSAFLSTAPLLALSLVVACGAGDAERPVAAVQPSVAPAPGPSVAPAVTSAPPAAPAANPNGLTLPVKLSGDAPALPAALRGPEAAKGARARCVITRGGTLTDCTILEAPPSTAPLVLAALATWRYQPAMLKGAPIASQNVIDVAFAVPESAPALPPPAAHAPDEVLTFSEDMARPRLVSGKNPDYTPEARAAGVEGQVIVRCVITVTGALRDCKILKSIPQLDQTVLDTLATQVYTPVVYKGQPVNVKYVLTFNFKLR